MRHSEQRNDRWQHPENSTGGQGISHWQPAKYPAPNRQNCTGMYRNATVKCKNHKQGLNLSRDLRALPKETDGMRRMSKPSGEPAISDDAM